MDGWPAISYKLRRSPALPSRVTSSAHASPYLRFRLTWRFHGLANLRQGSFVGGDLFAHSLAFNLGYVLGVGLCGRRVQLHRLPNSWVSLHRSPQHDALSGSLAGANGSSGRESTILGPASSSRRRGPRC